jgi:hypothetical protein
LPDRAGQPTHIQLHLTLDQLRNLPGGAGAETAWLAAQGTGSGQPGWLSGHTAQGYTCDAAITPLVTGHLNSAALDAMTTAFLARHHGPCPVHDHPGQHGARPGYGGTGRGSGGPGPHGGGRVLDGCRCAARSLPLPPWPGCVTPCCGMPSMCCPGQADWPRS